MHQIILSSAQARNARESLGLSQGKVATDLQLNRSYLSQFESGKRLLDDEELGSLRGYFEAEGYEFVDTPTEEGNGIRVMDGFAIPVFTGATEADVILTEYAENKVKLQSLAEQKIPEGFIFGINEEELEEKTREALCLMARNYSLIEQLHGRETISPCHSDRVLN